MLFGFFPIHFLFTFFTYYTHTGWDAAFLSILYIDFVYLFYQMSFAFVYNPLNSVLCVPLAEKHLVFTVHVYTNGLVLIRYVLKAFSMKP